MIARRRPGIEFRCDDPSLTPYAGLALVAETVRVLDATAVLDRFLGPLKVRRREVSGGELLVALGESMLVGGDFFSDLDTLRAGAAGAVLRTIAETPASTPALGLARRFSPEQLAALPTAQAELVGRHVAALPRRRRRALLGKRPTIDVDPTDVEVRGPRKNELAGPTLGSGPGGRLWSPGRTRVWCSLVNSWPGTRTPAPQPRIGSAGGGRAAHGHQAPQGAL
jgi:hypothetical protein